MLQLTPQMGFICYYMPYIFELLRNKFLISKLCNISLGKLFKMHIFKIIRQKINQSYYFSSNCALHFITDDSFVR